LGHLGAGECNVETARRIAIAAGGRLMLVALITAMTTGVVLREGWAQPGPTATTGFQFALIGDLGYNAEQDALFANVLAEIDATPNLAFVVHDGDLWGDAYGGCRDEFYPARLDLFQRSVHPFIFTPGDNDWTDCWQERNGGYDQLDRLALLRGLFFSDSSSLGQRRIELNRQSADPAFVDYPENARWSLGGVTFLTLHVVGSNNNLGTGVDSEQVVATAEEWNARTKANLDWLRQGFADARAANSRAVMIVQQANPYFELQTWERTGFNELIDALREETVAFGRPVVLVHGDTHYFRIDKPLLASRNGPRIENFTRVETFGEPDHHWVHVTVNPADPNVFTFRQRIVEANVGVFRPR
jgi:hypothetical protein